MAQAREWARKLQRNDGLRIAVRPLLGGGPVSHQAVEEALKRLAEPARHRWQAVTLAATVLGEAHLERPERERAIELLRPLASLRPPRNVLRPLARGAALGGAAAVAVVGLIAACFALSSGVDAAEVVAAFADPLTPALVAVAVGMLLGILVAAGSLPPVPFIGAEPVPTVRQAAMSALAMSGDMESIALIAHACEDASVDQHAGMSAALQVLLSQVTPESYGALPQEAVPRLCRTLLAHVDVGRAASWNDPQLAEAILGALERAGDGRAIDAVERLAVDGRGELLRARALEVLGVLQARQEEEREAGRLLRPAGAPDAGSHLLRPAELASDTPHDQLLRAVGGTDGKD